MNSLVEASISLSALQHNFGIAKKAAPKAKIMAVIKANAYGHGAIECAKALHLADAFAVARVDEALELREHGIQQDIIILSGIHSVEDLSLCEKHGLQAVIHSQETLTMAAGFKKLLAVWLKFDTGMHRLGLNPQHCAAIHQAMLNAKHLRLAGLISHFAAAEQPYAAQNTAQKQVFQHIQQHFPNMPISFCNSAGILWHPQAQHEWVRPGIMLYGANPGSINDERTSQLKSVMSLQAKVIHLGEVKAGEKVGYNGTWTAKTPSTIATVAIGYADGYPRHAKQGTPVEINNHIFPLIGRVSMDLITVDVSNSRVKVGDTVTLWGNKIKAETIAHHANTISYDLFTGIAQRVVRTYTS